MSSSLLLFFIFALIRPSLCQRVDGRYLHAATVLDKTLYLVNGLYLPGSTSTGANAISDQVVSIDLSKKFEFSQPPFANAAKDTGGVKPQLAGSRCFLTSDSQIKCIGGFATSKTNSPTELGLFTNEKQQIGESVFDKPSSSFSISPPSSASGLPSPRALHSTILHPSGKLYLYGGVATPPMSTRFTSVPTGGILNDFYVIDLTSPNATWVKLSGKDGLNPPPMAGGTIQIFKTNPDLIVLLGGVTEGGILLPMNEVWVWSLQSNSWSKVSVQGDAPLPRFGLASCSAGELIYIHGGLTSGAAGSVLLSDLRSLSYFAGPSFKWSVVFVPTISQLTSSNFIPTSLAFHSMTCVASSSKPNDAYILFSFGLSSDTPVQNQDAATLVSSPFFSVENLKASFLVYIFSVSTASYSTTYFPPENLASAVFPSLSTPVGSSGSLSIQLIVILVAISIVLVLAMIGFFVYLRRRQERNREKVEKRLSEMTAYTNRSDFSSSAVTIANPVSSPRGSQVLNSSPTRLAHNPELPIVDVGANKIQNRHSLPVPNVGADPQIRNIDRNMVFGEYDESYRGPSSRPMSVGSPQMGYKPSPMSSRPNSYSSGSPQPRSPTFISPSYLPSSNHSPRLSPVQPGSPTIGMSVYTQPIPQYPAPPILQAPPKPGIPRINNESNQYVSPPLRPSSPVFVPPAPKTPSSPPLGFPLTNQEPYEIHFRPSRFAAPFGPRPLPQPPVKTNNSQPFVPNSAASATKPLTRTETPPPPNGSHAKHQHSQFPTTAVIVDSITAPTSHSPPKAQSPASPRSPSPTEPEEGNPLETPCPTSNVTTDTGFVLAPSTSGSTHSEPHYTSMNDAYSGNSKETKEEIVSSVDTKSHSQDIANDSDLLTSKTEEETETEKEMEGVLVLADDVPSGCPEAD